MITRRERVERHRDSGGDMSLDGLLIPARQHTMTAAEREEQRMSWVIGELMLEHPEMTRDEAIRRYNDAVRLSDQTAAALRE